MDSFYSSPKEQILKNIEALTTDDKLIQLGVYDSKYITYIKDSFLYLISRNLCCVLNHGDISLSNTIISPEETVYWIDFGSVNANLLYSEFANLKIETKEDLVSFTKGFGVPITKIEEDLDIYRLLSSFDKLRWSLTTENDEYINWYRQNAIKTYKLFINNVKSQER